MIEDWETYPRFYLHIGQRLLNEIFDLYCCVSALSTELSYPRSGGNGCQGPLQFYQQDMKIWMHPPASGRNAHSRIQMTLTNRFQVYIMIHWPLLLQYGLKMPCTDARAKDIMQSNSFTYCTFLKCSLKCRRFSQCIYSEGDQNDKIHWNKLYFNFQRKGFVTLAAKVANITTRFFVSVTLTIHTYFSSQHKYNFIRIV